MGRGGAIYLSYTALVLLSSTAIAAADSIWHVDIDESPAPAPENGPPFSAHATRDRSLLPFQIIGIVGAYFGSVLILGTLLLTVGRSLRKQALERATRPTEMVKPAMRIYDPSPISPQSERSWYSPRRYRSKKSATASVRSGVSDAISPAMDSVVSFDNNVIEADRQRRQAEMERLYAAVMAQDERKSQQAVTTTTTEVSSEPPQYTQQQTTKPPRLITDAPALRHLQVQHAQEYIPRSPTTPKSPIRAIYPPDSPLPPMPTGPASPIRAEYPPTSPGTAQFYAQHHAETRTHHRERDSRTSSFGSSSTPPSTKKFRKSLRHLKISAPLPTSAKDWDDNSDGARTPLSPRFYADPGIPPEPPTARTIDSQYPPTTPGTAKSWRISDDHAEEGEEDMDQVRDLPHPYPSRVSGYNYANTPQIITDNFSTRPDPIAPAPGQAPSASPINRPLPLRQMALQQHQQQQQAAYLHTHPQQPREQFPLSPMRSAGPVKTTFLSPRHENFGGLGRGLATPYSPYMPFTPLTPVTPRLATRQERRQREREERRERGAMVEEEMVRDEGEVWGVGYEY